MTVQLRDGSTVTDPRLGRIPFLDPASRQYTIREHLTGLAETGLLARDTTAGKYWLPGPTLDQGQEGACVQFSTTDARNGSPDRIEPAETDYDELMAGYHEIQHADEWRGCYLGGKCPIDPDTKDTYGGTSTLAGAKWHQARGDWSEYRWIGAGSGTVEDDIIDTLSSVGGIVLGIPWYEGMYETSKSGLVRVEGQLAGYHAIHAFEWSPHHRSPGDYTGTRPVLWWHNSWGDSYGVKRRGHTGCGAILLDDVLTLMGTGDSEGLVPLK